MKKIVFLIALGMCGFLFSQEKLIIEYETKMLMDEDAIQKIADEIKVRAEGAAVNQQQMARMIAESMTKPTYYQLRLTPNESEYKMVETIENSQPNEGGVMVKVISGISGVIYKNLAENLVIKSQNTFDKDFLIVDSIKTIDWKISRESTEILGYEVRKAEAVISDKISVEAWYAPKLQFKNGPDNFQGLPGLILEVLQTNTDEDGETKFVHKAISLDFDKDKSDIKRPSKGKKVSREELDEFIKTQSEKIKDMYGGGVDAD